MTESRSKCYLCGATASYSKEHDALYCPVCNMWLEDDCGEEDCEFCVGRPESPLVNG